MRLICPNCDAQYDIADDVIPAGGRDVQCSSCAHTWFQTDKPTKEANTPPAPIGSILNAPPPPAASDEPARRSLDSSIADILREEAAREKARANNPTPPVVPTTVADLDAPTASMPSPLLRDIDTASTPVPPPPATSVDKQSDTIDPDLTLQRIAQMTDTASAVDTMERPPSSVLAPEIEGDDDQLHMVPTVDEINANLHARAKAIAEANRPYVAETEPLDDIEHEGFRRGFITVWIAIAVFIAPYFFADQITNLLPQSNGFMANYVATIDQLRNGLYNQLQSLRAMIS